VSVAKHKGTGGVEGESMSEPGFVIEEINDPAEVARCRAQHERSRRNSAWLASHWEELLPQAVGRFVAVEGWSRSLLTGTLASAATDFALR